MGSQLKAANKWSGLRAYQTNRFDYIRHISTYIQYLTIKVWTQAERWTEKGFSNSFAAVSLLWMRGSWRTLRVYKETRFPLFQTCYGGTSNQKKGSPFHSQLRLCVRAFSEGTGLRWATSRIMNNGKKESNYKKVNAPSCIQPFTHSISHFHSAFILFLSKPTRSHKFEPVLLAPLMFCS